MQSTCVRREREDRCRVFKPGSWSAVMRGTGGSSSGPRARLRQRLERESGALVNSHARRGFHTLARAARVRARKAHTGHEEGLLGSGRRARTTAVSSLPPTLSRIGNGAAGFVLTPRNHDGTMVLPNPSLAIMASALRRLAGPTGPDPSGASSSARPDERPGAPVSSEGHRRVRRGSAMPCAPLSIAASTVRSRWTESAGRIQTTR